MFSPHYASWLLISAPNFSCLIIILFRMKTNLQLQKDNFNVQSKMENFSERTNKPTEYRYVFKATSNKIASMEKENTTDSFSYLQRDFTLERMGYCMRDSRQSSFGLHTGTNCVADRTLSNFTEQKRSRQEQWRATKMTDHTDIVFLFTFPPNRKSMH